MYMIKGERRVDNPTLVIVDSNMEKEEAESSLLLLRRDFPHWKFWIEEEEDVSQSVCAKPELSV